jgi:hypothetical protein
MKATTIAATIALVVISSSANAQSARQPNPCRELSADQCQRETHCRYVPAATINYSVAGKDHTRDRKATCSLGIKTKAAKVTVKQ